MECVKLLRVWAINIMVIKWNHIILEQYLAMFTMPPRNFQVTHETAKPKNKNLKKKTC